MRLPAWHLHVDVLLLFGSIAAAYLIAIGRHERDTGELTPKRKVRLFLGGLVTLTVGASWPIHDLAERYLYSVHMAQHILFTLVAPPLLICGLPVWLLRRLISPPPVHRLVRFVTKPIVALAFFNAMLLFTHWPAIVELSVRSEWAHFGLHFVLVASALAMWWPVVSPLPEMPPLPPPGQMLYLFLQSLAPTIPASFLTFGNHLVYPVYATFPRIWGIGPLTDQLIAGLTMKIVGGLILWGVIAVVFFRWHDQERRGDGWDATRFRNVEREIRVELTK